MMQNVITDVIEECSNLGFIYCIKPTNLIELKGLLCSELINNSLTENTELKNSNQTEVEIK